MECAGSLPSRSSSRGSRRSTKTNARIAEQLGRRLHAQGFNSRICGLEHGLVALHDCLRHAALPPDGQHSRAKDARRARCNSFFDGFDGQDLLAISVFLFAWLGYHIIMERTARGANSLNARMNAYRLLWMHEMLKREVRVVDSTIMSTLQGGTAFFASTSLFAIGGSLAMLQATEAAIRVFDDIPFAVAPTRAEFELKVIRTCGDLHLCLLQICLGLPPVQLFRDPDGAVPDAKQAHDPKAIAAADRAAEMNKAAGNHFNRGQRAFFFALAYLGWFLHPFVFIAATLAALIVILRRQFGSDAARALQP